MSRSLAPLTAAAVEKPVIPLAALVYLDVQNDPLWAWSGIGDLTFAAGETGDPSLDGKTFKGTGTLIEVSASSEGIGGSDALDIGLPGVDLNDNELKQLLTDRRRWQFRRAIVWLMVLDEVTGAIAGKPFRIKTGRMDKMPISENGKTGVVKCKIEGQQAYGNEPLATRYSEQRDINPNDTSQRFVHSLANMAAQVGQASMPTGAGASGNGGSNSGGSTGGGSVGGGGGGNSGGGGWGGGGGGAVGWQNNNLNAY